MSAMPLRAPARPRAGEAPGPSSATPVPSRPTRLRVVRAPAQRRERVPFILACVTILGSALLGALLVNTTMAQTAYAIHDHQIQLARLTERKQELSQQLEVAASPQQLATRARAEGMVPAPAPAFLRLSDGTIVGESVPAKAAG